LSESKHAEIMEFVRDQGDVRAALRRPPVLRDGGFGELIILVEDAGIGLQTLTPTFGTRRVSTVIADRGLFERDVRDGSLGEFLAMRLLEPYEALDGAEYLSEQESLFKTRIVREEVANLAARFKDLLPEILIDPRYFFHARMQRRSKIHPPARKVYLTLISNPTQDFYGFKRTLEEMARDGLIKMDRFVRVTEKFISQLPAAPPVAIAPFKEAEMLLRRLAAYGLVNPSVESLVLEFTSVEDKGPSPAPPDPKSYLYLPIEGRLVPVDDRRTLEEVVLEEGLAPKSPMTVRRIGGILNSVYLIEFEGADGKLVAKTFLNWVGLKWIPLSIWAIGAQNFEVLADRRLANEYKMNRFLRKNGVNAPTIEYVSVPRATIIEQFVEGRSFSDLARDYLSKPEPEKLDAFRRAGEVVGRIHSLGASMGDCKPDNMIEDRDGDIWVVDLEQASLGGSPAWDLAEFLYYTGHYTFRWRRMESLARAFIDGYLVDGEVEMVKEISKARYKRIFGIMTAPHIIVGISRLCSSYSS